MAVVKDGKVLFSKGYGYADLESRTQIAFGLPLVLRLGLGLSLVAALLSPIVAVAALLV